MISLLLLEYWPNSLTTLLKINVYPTTLAALGKLTQDPDANIIKLPNISASVQQLVATIKELQSKGYAIPDFPGEPKTEEEKEIRKRYGKSLGSSVNPVLREGNSDRRAPKAVKNFARKHPHSMGEWKQWSSTHVSHMHKGDFYDGEQSMTLDKPRTVRMERLLDDGTTKVLKPEIALQDKEVIDLMFMSKKALLEFYEQDNGRLPRIRHLVFIARKSHHDESIAPYRLWSRGSNLL